MKSGIETMFSHRKSILRKELGVIIRDKKGDISIIRSHAIRIITLMRLDVMLPTTS